MSLKYWPVTLYNGNKILLKYLQVYNKLNHYIRFNDDTCGILR